MYGYDKILLNKSDSSNKRLLTRSNSIIINSSIKSRHQSHSFELSSILQQDEEVIKVSENISEVSPYDFGFYQLDRNYCNEDEYRNNKSRSDSKLNLKDFNLINHLNDTKYDEKTNTIKRVISNFKDLITHYAKEENDYHHFTLPETDKNEPAFEENQIQNTYNSYILNQQIIEVSKNNFESAIRRNIEYKNKKSLYEIEMISYLLNKYESSNKPGSKIIILNSQSYINLRNDSSELRNQIFNNKNPNHETIMDWKARAKIFLINFAKSIEYSLDDKPKDRIDNLDIKNNIVRNCTKWKRKISELVNIWELFYSNGVELKFSGKYLILKKYYMLRAKEKMNSLEFFSNSNEEEGNFLTKLISLFFMSKPKGSPKSIIMPNEIIYIIIQIISSLFLIYNLFMIPLVQFLNYKNEKTVLIDNLIDVLFFIQIFLNFRTVYKDKYNNYVSDINKIFWNYLTKELFFDLLTTFPWDLFFISSKKILTSVQIVVNNLRVIRVFRLWPIFNKLESIKGISFIKMIRLIFIYFFIVHWMGCILMNLIYNSIDYSQFIPECYIYQNKQIKENIRFECKYIIAIYNSAYIIPGEYVSNMKAETSLYDFYEYITLVLMYMIGQVVSTYIFGGMTSIIQNLDQGHNFLTKMIDLLNEHMIYYGVNHDTMCDVKTYFDYLWQKQKDVIYGKQHFDLLSKSLREKFERLNLLGNEFILAQFYNLNPGNPKLVGNILINLTKNILFPYEILFEELSVTKGVYIILNGDIHLSNKVYEFNIAGANYNIDYADIIKEASEKKKEIKKNGCYNEKYSMVFPLVSALVKTGRNLQRCYSENFTDLLFLPIEAFDQLIYNFPIEMHILKHKVINYVESLDLFSNKNLFNAISQHSSRSVSKYYSLKYNKINIWIPIPIPISQFKLGRNYIDSFIRKVRNQWREIVMMGDLNLCLNSYSFINVLNKQENKDKNEKSNNNFSDPIDHIKYLSKTIEQYAEKIMINNNIL